jgi:diguanylate cyclase
VKRRWKDILGGESRRKERLADRREDRGSGDRLPRRDGARALETLSDVLVSLGRHAFDIEESTAEERRELFEGWSRHVALRVPAPGDEPRADGGPARRNWAGVRHFVSRQRQAERSHVAASTGSLRAALWAVVQGLSWTVLEAQASDEKLRGELQRFLGEVREAPPEHIVKQVWSLVDRMQEIVAERQDRQNKHLNQLGEQMRIMRSELTAARRSMESDPLTRLFNRRAFDEQLERLAALNTISGDASTLVMVDIDHFKQVNDRHGHPAGDEVLRQLSRCLVNTFPRRTDFIARYGGEEFVVLFERDPLDQVRPLLQRLLEAVREMEVTVDDEVIRITISAGAAEQSPGEEHGSWLKRADDALYRAKRGGRDQVAEAGPPAVE